MTFPNCGGAVPPLPPKSLFCEASSSAPDPFFAGADDFVKDKFRPSFLKKRRDGLAYFLKCVHCSRRSSLLSFD